VKWNVQQNSEVKSLVLIPTYNEVDNVKRIFQEIRELGLETDFLFLDDNSPDGTGAVIDRLSEKHPGVHVIHRPGKLGIGSAHKAGILWAYQNGYHRLITIDCDFTHKPSDIPRLLDACGECELVIGSRYLRSKSLAEWNLFRRGLTHLGHFLTKRLLGIPYDASGAFRIYRLDKIPQGAFDLVYSTDYSFFFESLHVLSFNKVRVREVPIDLPARTYGQSKMSYGNAAYSLLLLVYLCLKTMIDKQWFEYPGSLSVKGGGEPALTTEQWNAYWRPKQSPSGLMYDLAASVYRKLIIRRALRHFLTECFQSNQKILHAGCGSGQVDAGCVQGFKVHALDISSVALARYRQLNGNTCQVIAGDILRIPIADGSFDGVYNLGVMEHFTPEQINQILVEFHRVLAPGGKVVLFWPPSFGLTVRFLKFVHYVANEILKKDTKLHPDEITLVESREQVQRFMTSAGFSGVQYYFGILDFYTHVVIVAQKDALSGAHNRVEERRKASSLTSLDRIDRDHPQSRS